MHRDDWSSVFKNQDSILNLEIDLFQKELQKMFEKNDSIDFNFQSKIQKKSLEYGMKPSEYIEFIEENQFLVDEWQKMGVNCGY